MCHWALVNSDLPLGYSLKNDQRQMGLHRWRWSSAFLLTFEMAKDALCGRVFGNGQRVF